MTHERNVHKHKINKYRVVALDAWFARHSSSGLPTVWHNTVYCNIILLTNVELLKKKPTEIIWIIMIYGKHIALTKQVPAKTARQHHNAIPLVENITVSELPVRVRLICMGMGSSIYRYCKDKSRKGKTIQVERFASKNTSLF